MPPPNGIVPTEQVTVRKVPPDRGTLARGPYTGGGATLTQATSTANRTSRGAPLRWTPAWYPSNLPVARLVSKPPWVTLSTSGLPATAPPPTGKAPVGQAAPTC